MNTPECPLHKRRMTFTGIEGYPYRCYYCRRDFSEKELQMSRERLSTDTTNRERTAEEWATLLDDVLPEHNKCDWPQSCNPRCPAWQQSERMAELSAILRDPAALRRLAFGPTAEIREMWASRRFLHENVFTVVTKDLVGPDALDPVRVYVVLPSEDQQQEGQRG